MSPEKKEYLHLGKRIIVFIGPEGSGKTTMAKRLAEETGRPYITTGDIIRDLAANDEGPLGDECRQMFATRSYLNGATLLRILVQRFSNDDTVDGFVLDGGLRTLEETEDFQDMLEQADRCLPLSVIHLRIPAWMSFDRLVTGPLARQRNDDTVEGVTSRLGKFYLNLARRVDVIRSQPNWDLLHVDATGPIEKTYSKVKSVLGID